MSPSWSQIAALVEKRAKSRCEYCRMHQSLQGATFHIEHIVPESRGGISLPENLAWCCPSCNLHKSDRTEGEDFQTGAIVPIFQPRKDVWKEHFGWEVYEVIGRTAVGRATIALLKLNSARRVLIRQAEERFSLFPASD